MIRKILPLFVSILVMVSCNKPVGEVVGIGARDKFQEAQPYGMVYVKRGSFLMGTNDESAFSSTTDKPITVTVDAFWMDETETTNSKYKQFVYYVRDSVALRLLVMGGKDEFRLTTKNQEDEAAPEVARLNWKVLRKAWTSKDEEIKNIVNSIYTVNETGKRSIDPIKLRYQYQWTDFDQAALYKNKINVNTGAYMPGASVKYDSAYIKDGVIVKETGTRPLRTVRDLISTNVINIYPDTMTWLRDFQYSYNDPKMKLYFSHPGYVNYPVVGVTWEQAQAFCYWRTQLFNNSHKIIAQEYRLPTEAEWEYAARGGRKMAMYPWGGNYIRDEKGCYLANFKPMRGSYSGDLVGTTGKVGQFKPNDYGLYDMAGNVSEWTSTTYFESSNDLVSDMNPSYRYNAKNGDADVFKRKVIRGGSWKDIAYFLQCGVRDFEYQYESRPYIGFRCVRSYAGE